MHLTKKQSIFLILGIVVLIAILIFLISWFTVLKNLSLSGNITSSNISYSSSASEYISPNSSKPTTANPLTTITETVKEIGEKIFNGTQGTEISIYSTTENPFSTITETFQEIGEKVFNETQDMEIFTNSTMDNSLLNIMERFTEFGEKKFNRTQGTEIPINSTTLNPLRNISETVKDLGGKILNKTQATEFPTNSTTLNPLTTVTETVKEKVEKILYETQDSGMKINLGKKYCHEIFKKNIKDVVIPFDEIEKIYEYYYVNSEENYAEVLFKNGDSLKILADENGNVTNCGWN
ncbi:hypothetical protein DMUE_1989 [Dictyocoela muelleri]|nr:hypothetical protein DMUE_1989 [Dictyocoela muelleri]